MKQLKRDIIEIRDEFFTKRGWVRKKCPKCSADYFTKRDLPNCGSYQCTEGYTFLGIPAPKSYLELGVCLRRLREFFSVLGYSYRPPIAIVRQDERTLFASTAGQIYDNLIYGKTTHVETTRCVVLQPVIRLQGINLVGTIEGLSTSFVHAATECWNASGKEYFGTFNHWLDFFSELGLHVGGLCLKIKRANNDWAGNVVTSEMLKVNYGGLEIGVANFFLNIPQSEGKVATLSDIGVGAERLVWAVNKSPSYFDSIGPLSRAIMDERVILDAVRTATLMIASGVVPGHKNHGSKLRMIVGLIAKSAHYRELHNLVRHYYAQWASLITLLQTRDRTYAVLRQELDRNINLTINRALGIDEPFEQENEEFLRSIVRKKIVSIGRLREILRRKET